MLEHQSTGTSSESMEPEDNIYGFGQVSAISFIEGNNYANGAIAFATSNGFFNIILNLSDDLTRSTNRVETFILKGKHQKIVAMKGVMSEVHTTEDEEGGNETK